MKLIRFFKLPDTTYLEQRKAHAVENISSRINYYRKILSCNTGDYTTSKTIMRNLWETSMGPRLPDLARRTLKSSSVKPYQ
jgi:hypothetical protein